MASTCSCQTVPVLVAGANALLPPPGTNWLAAIKPSIIYLMLVSTMGSVEVVMLFAMLFFSTVQIRRKPIFIVNVLAVSLGIGGAIVIGFESMHGVLSPADPLPYGWIILSGVFDNVIPILASTVLLLRLYAVFPPSQTSRTKFIAILALPMLIKIVRLVIATICLTNLGQNTGSMIGSDTPKGDSLVIVTSKLPCATLGWSLQICDDTYCSLVFLIRLRSGSSGSAQTATQSISTFGRRLKTLFWISVTNFVFPAILSITQLTIYLVSSSNYLLVLYVETANVHVTIIGVVFATIWATADRHVGSERTVTNSVFVARRVSVANTSGTTSLALREPDEGHVWRDDGKTADLRSPPGHLEVNMGHLEGPLGFGSVRDVEPEQSN